LASTASLRVLKPVRIDREIAVFELGEGWVAVSNCFGAGVLEPRYLVMASVSECGEDLDVLYEAVARRAGVDRSESVIMITALPIAPSLRVAVKDVDGTRVEMVMTAGFEPVACVDYDTVYENLRGTINIAIAIDDVLSVSALLDAFRTVVESKAAASADLGLRCTSRAVGTVTDAIAVFGRKGEHGIALCGIATKLGNAIAKIVRDSLVSAFTESADLDELLRHALGLGLDELVELAMRVYREAPVPGVDESRVRSMIRARIVRMLEDPNVWSFIIASRELDLRGSVGTLWRLPREEFASDSTRIVADEILGISLALYVAGFRGLFTLFWVERLKRRVGGLRKIASLPMFEDDIASALIASALTLVYNELLGTAP